MANRKKLCYYIGMGNEKKTCKLTKEQVASLVGRGRAGVAHKDIAAEFDVDPDTVRYHLLKAGVVSKVNNKTHKLSSEQISGMVEAYKIGDSALELAQRLGIDKKNVYYYLRKMGIPVGDNRELPPSPEVTEKLCTGCEEVKPAEAFPKDGERRRSRCQACCSDAHQDWVERNQEHLDEYKRQYYQDNKEVYRQHKREWYQENKEEVAAADRFKRYGVTPEDVALIFEAQNGCCRICGATEPGGPGTWHVDHIHAFSKEKWKTLPPEEKRKYVRGLLCNGCNHGIGKLKDSPVILRAAADYLERGPFFK